MKAVLDIVARHRAGEAVGLYSVCSAHPLAIEAALRHARDRAGVALVEATSNQVNQDGGYTGLRPADFRDRVLDIAAGVGLAAGRVVLGGDHLGPNCWQTLPAAEAMARSRVMVADYVSAGFRKIHLDCSMRCADDAEVLGDDLIAARSADLCVQAEAAWRNAGGEPPVYVIGSEVPVPGGAHEALDQLAATAPAAALATVAAHRSAFARSGLQPAWNRVIGLVVQPGVEFDHDHVVDYLPAKASSLSACIDSLPNLVFEAHSTDYQLPEALASLVRDHYAILKVGPAVTFALREALFAIDDIVRELDGGDATGGIRETALGAMQADPSHWRRYYHATGHALRLQQQYSLSDRIRYYWPSPSVAAAVQRISSRFDAARPPLALVSQFLPGAVGAIRAGAVRLEARELVIHHIRAVLAHYSSACTPLKA